MKIGFVLDDTLDTSDGVQQYVLLLGEWLREQGHNVHYLVGETARTDILNMHSLSQNKRVSFNKNKLSIPYKINKKELRRLVQNGSWDVLHVQMPYSPLLAGKIVAYATPNTAVVGTFHIAPHSNLVSLSTKALGHINKRTIRRFNEVISVSEVAKSFAKTTFGINSQVIPNAVDTNLWKSPGIKRSTDIVFVGRLVERKGCILLLQAINKLVVDQDFKSVKLKIAGDGPQREELEAYVQRHGLQEKVEFLGFVSEEEKRKLLHRAQIAVFPSTGGESFGIVLIEAMAAGALVLGGNNPGYKAVLKDVPDTIVSLEPKAIVSSIRRTMSNHDRYKRIVRAQQEVVKRFDINTVGSDILTVYKRAVHEVQKQ